MAAETDQQVICEIFDRAGVAYTLNEIEAGTDQKAFTQLYGEIGRFAKRTLDRDSASMESLMREMGNVGDDAVLVLEFREDGSLRSAGTYV